ncbi:MAG: DUF6498-containing protein [Patescibacteria group bacterium]
MNRFKYSSKPALAALVLANVLPVWSAYYSGITPAGLVFLYWLETWVIAFYNSLKIKKAVSPMSESEINLMKAQLFARGDGEMNRESILRVFIKQSVAVLLVYGTLLFAVLVPHVFAKSGDYISRVLVTFSGAGLWSWVLISFAGLTVSHGVSYYSNFLGKKEFLNVSPARQMLQLGDRLIAMHLLLMFSSIFIGVSDVFGAFGAVAGIALVKIIVDVAAHSREHMITQALGLPTFEQAGPGILMKAAKFFLKGGRK